MSFDVLAILFIVFSVVSSLVNKMQERRRMAEREDRELVDVPKRSIPESDLSEWDVLREPEPEPEPMPVEPVREFREVRGATPVSESDTGPEFQEVQVTRPVSETYTGQEFVDPLVEDDDRVDVQKVVAKELRDRPSRRCRKANVLRFDKDALVNAILYQEILGSPRSERMP
ncbi:MAG: hypothetical protein CME19_17985 [Gemmatimonadetes bacterium]|nr:hypothetical protein [Gemmatimonadota bacterium]|tara:strand:- start:9 stop:524 length:516 start_codon:yes stop_codon:yes gene_type:complete